jgi:hypothetical protein
MPITARNDANFKGTLLQRRYKPGQAYVLLLFRTDNGLRYGLSKNLRLAQSMLIGNQYSVKGREYTTGHKTYLNMISATVVRPRHARFRKRIGLLASAASLVIIVGSVSTSFLVHRNEPHNNQTEDTSNGMIESSQDTHTPGTAKKLKGIITPQPGTVSVPSPSAATAPQSGTSATRPVPAPTPPPEINTDDPTPAPTADPSPTPVSDPTPAPDPAPDPIPATDPTSPPPTDSPLVDPTTPPPTAPADQSLVSPDSVPEM